MNLLICFRLVADTGKCLIGSSVIYKKKSSIDSIANEACKSFLLDLEAKSCVDFNTMDHVINKIKYINNFRK